MRRATAALRELHRCDLNEDLSSGSAFDEIGVRSRSLLEGVLAIKDGAKHSSIDELAKLFHARVIEEELFELSRYTSETRWTRYDCIEVPGDRLPELGTGEGRLGCEDRGREAEVGARWFLRKEGEEA